MLYIARRNKKDRLVAVWAVIVMVSNFLFVLTEKNARVFIQVM